LDREKLLKWLDQILSTNEAEIDCDELQAVLPEYVELQLAGGNGAALNDRLTAVRAHLAHCADCAEEYQGLQAVVDLERKGGRLPTVDESLDQFEPTSSYEHAK
jgi:hypothetical protein